MEHFTVQARRGHPGHPQDQHISYRRIPLADRLPKRDPQISKPKLPKGLPKIIAEGKRLARI